MLLTHSFTKSRISISGTPRQQREYLHFTSEGVTNFLQLYADLKWRSRGPRCELSLLYRCEEPAHAPGPWAESPGPAASSLLRGPSLDVLMALTFFNKHLEEPAEGLLLDTLSPQAWGKQLSEPRRHEPWSPAGKPRLCKCTRLRVHTLLHAKSPGA